MMDRFDIEPIEHRGSPTRSQGAQKKVEGMHFDDRKHVVEYDDVMNTQREIVYGSARRSSKVRTPARTFSSTSAK